MRKLKRKISMVLLGISFCYCLWLIPSTQIKASTNKIAEIDTNTYYTYELSEINNKLTEEKLLNLEMFDGFVQADSFVHSWVKKNFNSNALPIDSVGKKNSSRNLIVVDDGLISLDYFSNTVLYNQTLDTAQLNKMNFDGENIKTVYPGGEPVFDLKSVELMASTNYIPMTQEIIQNEEEKTITVLGLGDNEPKIDVFDYDLNQLYSTTVENTYEELLLIDKVVDYTLSFQEALLIGEQKVLLKPKVYDISPEMDITLPIMSLSEDYTRYESVANYLKLGQLKTLNSELSAPCTVVVDDLYFGKNNYTLMSVLIYDSVATRPFNYYVLFDEAGNYVKKLDVATDFVESSQYENTVYLSNYDPASDSSVLHGFSFDDNQCTTLKTYESIQSLHIYEEDGLLIAYGKTTGLEKEKNIVSNRAGTFIATLADSYNFDSVTLFPNDSVELSIKNIYKLPNGQDYFVDGIVKQEDASFELIDSVNVTSDYQWSQAFEFSEDINLFFGRIEKVQDHAPAINAGRSIVLNKDEIDFSNKTLDENNYTLKDRLLLFGSAEIDYTSDYAIKAYDTYDLEEKANLMTQEEFNKKINRNPNNEELAIDWSALGFDENEIGPQRTIYFVSDSQKQVSSTSKIVNVIDNQTVYEENQGKIALRAEDFIISLQDAAFLTADMLTDKETTGNYGNVFAWDLEDELLNYNANIVVDSEQLDEINQANKFGKFSLTYQLTVDNCTIQRETFVYVLDDNSEQMGDVLFHVSNGMIPWDVTSTSSIEELSTLVSEGTHISAYDFATGEELTDKIVPFEEDLVNLQNLEPENEDMSTIDMGETLLQEIRYKIGEQMMGKTSAIEVYYRFEDIHVMFVDHEFSPIYSSENENSIPFAVTIENQIVGKTTGNFLRNKEIEKAILTLNQQGYYQDGLYTADKTTELINDEWVVICQHGKGNQLYIKITNEE